MLSFVQTHQRVVGFSSGQVWRWESWCIDYCLMLLKPNINLVFPSLAKYTGVDSLTRGFKASRENSNWSKNERSCFGRKKFETAVSSEGQTVLISQPCSPSAEVTDPEVRCLFIISLCWGFSICLTWEDQWLSLMIFVTMCKNLTKRTAN